MEKDNKGRGDKDKGRDRDAKDDAADETGGGGGGGGEDGQPRWADMIRRVMSVGLGAAFMTEESIRGALGDIKLPKDVLNNILQGAVRSKEDFLNRIGNETIRLISKIDFVKEASRFVEEHKFRIQAEIEVVKKTSATHGEPDEPTVQVKSKVHIR